MNEIQNCLLPSNLIAIMGRPASGKTSLALNIIKHLADNEKPVLMFSFEIPAGQIALRRASFFCNDACGMNMSEIRAKARALKKQQNLQLIVIDYLQLAIAMPSSNSYDENLSEMAKEMKAMANELHIPVIVLVQVRRIKKPSGSPVEDFPEARVIEPEADVCIITADAENQSWPNEEKKLFIKKKSNETGIVVSLPFLKKLKQM